MRREETLRKFSGGDDAKLDLEGSIVRRRRKNILSRRYTDTTHSILGKIEKHMQYETLSKVCSLTFIPPPYSLPAK